MIEDIGAAAAGERLAASAISAGRTRVGHNRAALEMPSVIYGRQHRGVRFAPVTTSQTPPAARTVRTLGRARTWLASRTHQAIAAFVLYAAIAIGYFGVHVVPHLGRICVCAPGGADPSIFMWSLAWWPHALVHGMNPFFTNSVFAPQSVDLGGSTTIPGAALALAPVTLLFGPVVSYNVLMLGAPVLAAFFAFLLCRYITCSFPASLVGGYLFGFSAYMFGQLLGHAHLVLIFPIPAAVHLTLRLIDKRISERRFIALMALILVALLYFSTEISFTFVLLGGLSLVVAFVLAPDARGRLIDAVKAILLAGVVAALVASPVIFHAIKANVTPNADLGNLFGGDTLGFLVPTMIIRLGRRYFAAVSAGFTRSDPSESGIYIGLPLLLILGRYTITRWGRASTKILVAMLTVVVVLLLGSYLHVATYPTIPLPWKLIDHSLIREAVPARLGLYLFLIVAILVAMWLAQPRGGNWGRAKWALVAVGIMFLLPNIGSGLWRWSPPNPTFFTTHQYRYALKRGETVLVLPYGSGGWSMLWQAETGMWYRTAGGYLNPTPPADYASDPLLPALYGQAEPNPQVLRSFLARRHVGAVIVDPAESRQWPQALATLGLKPLRLGGIWFYPV
jgi:hypothetical protein